MKAFLLSFQDMKALDGGTRKTLTSFLDNRPEIMNWHSPYERLVIVISEESATQLRHLIHGQFPDWFFILAPLDKQTCTGWMHQATWEFIKNCGIAGQWERLQLKQPASPAPTNGR